MLASLRREDRYHVVGALGQGSVGIVERVVDTQVGRVVARKTLRPEMRDDANALRAFVNEAKILGSLDHGGVIPIFDAYFSDDERPVYTMRETDGETLSEVLQMDRPSGRVVPLPLDRTLRIIRQLCEALAHAHDRGVIHLDLKPQNVVIQEYDEVVLVDWGTAFRFAPERAVQKLEAFPELASLSNLIPEEPDLIVGTPRYMSPEQTEQARGTLRPASDIFSLGILFYQMLTGQLPFEGESLEEILFHIRETEPPSPQSINGSLPRRLSSIVLRMLAKAPEDRYAGFAEILSELRAFRSSGAEFPERLFAEGERIFSEDEVGDFACVIAAGEVEISTGEGERRRVLGRHFEGEVIGELALLREMPRSATATALCETRVRMIDSAALTTEVDGLNPWVRMILGGVVERFVDRSERLVELLNEGAEEQ
ncbi:MAG: protein kinase [Myxococcota bacterium]